MRDTPATKTPVGGHGNPGDQPDSPKEPKANPPEDKSSGEQTSGEQSSADFPGMWRSRSATPIRVAEQLVHNHGGDEVNRLEFDEQLESSSVNSLSAAAGVLLFAGTRRWKRRHPESGSFLFSKAARLARKLVPSADRAGSIFQDPPRTLQP